MRNPLTKTTVKVTVSEGPSLGSASTADPHSDSSSSFEKILKFDSTRGIACYMDASFASEWDKTRSDDPSTILSRTGYVIMYQGCPILFVSEMQTEIALSTTEAEYIALSQAMCDLIPFTDMAKELSAHYHELLESPKILCRLFEDNNRALIFAKDHKYRPRTKHISLKYHHFRSFVKEGKVEIFQLIRRNKLQINLQNHLICKHLNT